MSDVDATTKPVEATPVEATPAEATPVEEQKTADAAEDTSMIKTTAQIDREDVKKNNKFDPSVRDVTDDPEAIRKQVSPLPCSTSPTFSFRLFI